MSVISLTDPNSGSNVLIAPNQGFNAYEFTAQVRDWKIRVLDSDPAFPTGTLKPSRYGIPILFPFPNRIRGGRFTWEGREYVIPVESGRHDAMGNAIHGFCLDRPWRVTSQGERFAVGQFQLSVDAPERRGMWPTDFILEFRYEVRGNALRCDIRIENPDKVPLPWGLGTHPYFRLPLDETSQPERCMMQVPASREWVLIDGVPTGEIKEVSPEKDLRSGEYFDVLKLDDVLTDVEILDGASTYAIFDEAAGLQVVHRSGSEFRECVVFTPPNRPCVCMEPYTCATDAINLQARGVDAGLRVLPPGGQAHLWFEISASALIV